MYAQRIKAGLHAAWIMGILTFGWILPSEAQAISTANHWLERCTPDEGKVKLDCIAFLYGMNEYNLTLRVIFDVHIYCPPLNFTVDQMRRVVLKYLNENPDKLHGEFAVLVVAALKRSFPCSKPAKN